ncbi:aldose 1-epimerase family protein [Flavihumibacter profundi]|uniref:aldose 1-epimerase family protein n=1 Tax=Flavihumibacter profundi TaxID=2716883 RepID=UPI001CC3EACA|nr:aldose 1-epimerase family protein [Flavihumibacter profundi]MBZ5856097.1 aldose 1-epimerase family protein [Flavihumibacter profundi]
MLQPFHHKLSHHSQLGGIETAVLDNGPERGTRIAWINTGTGLRFKVVIDRAMDIADAFYNQHSLGWMNATGVRPPQMNGDKGIDWLKTFGGGLLTTCGLTHVGGPESDEYGERGLHGPISNTPAEIESIIQPDPIFGKMEMSITGKIPQTHIFGPCLELRRTISCVLGQPFIHIHDEVTNRGNTVAPHMLLYHCNFGWPLADEGAQILWKGEWQPGNPDCKIFSATNDFHTCPAPLQSHNGSGEEVAFIDIAADDEGTCTCGLYNPKINVALAIRFSKSQLPWLTNWQHWGEGEYVTGIEPGTNPPIGQSKARAQNTLLFLAPGETRMYDLHLQVLHTRDEIQSFINDLTITQ